MTDINYFTTDVPVPVRHTVLRPRPLLVRLITEHNPFYLLSAACMLASCLALTNSLSWTSISRTRLVALIVTLNVYELALLGIALFLVARRRLVRDGRMLLILQFAFLADFTFLNAEVTSINLGAGVVLNAALFLLAAVKLGVVVRVLRAPVTPAQYAFVLVQLFAIYAIPSILKWLDGRDGVVGSQHLYIVWWAAGLMPALYELLTALDRQREPADLAVIALRDGPQAAPVRTYLALPYVSLLTHVGILHYVHDAPFYGANAAPVLLGLTLVLNRLGRAAPVPGNGLNFLRVVLPLAAVFVSLNNPFRFTIRTSYPALTLTPVLLSVAGAYVTFVYCFLRRHGWVFLATGAAAATFYVFGPSRRQVVSGARSAWEWTTALVDRLVPKNATDWGTLGLIASFAFLGLGLWVSLRKRPDAHFARADAMTLPPEG